MTPVDRESAERRAALKAAADRAILVKHIARMAEGHREALREVYELTSAKLNALLMRMLRDRTAAEEVLQEVYLTVWRQGATFDPARSSPITWLVAIARNKAIDRMRIERVRTATHQPIDEIEEPADGFSIVDSLEAKEQRARLFVCLEGLEERQQRMIRAAFFEGLTYEALALRENVPLGTMKSWIRRGLLRLRSCLDE